MTNEMNAKPEPTTADVLTAAGDNRAAIRAINKIFACTVYRPKTVRGKRHTTAAEVERSHKREIKVNRAILRLIAAGDAAKAAWGTSKAGAKLTAFQRAYTALVNIDGVNLPPYALSLSIAVFDVSARLVADMAAAKR
jgi:hypothetical protein